MEFRLKPAPYLKGKRSIKGMMFEFFCVLCAVWIYAIVFNFTTIGTKAGVSSILIGIVAIVVSILCDLIAALLSKVKKEELIDHCIHSYSYVTGLILALTLPANTSIFAVIIVSIFGTVIGKLVFGGFGYNIVNPAGIGRILAALSFNLGTSNVKVVDSISGATVTSSMDYFTGKFSSYFTTSDLFFGNYFGAMGETCTLLLIICAIYLVVRNIIDYRLTVSYVFTSFVIALALGFVLPGVNDAFMYAFNNLLLGGLMFGAVFMVTDPVTTPTSPTGKFIFGIGAAMLTMLFRVCTSMPEGCVFSIILMNLFTPLIDSCITGDSKTKIWKKWLVVAIALIIAVGVVVGFAELRLTKIALGIKG